jgi:hypothetical protein
LSNKSAVSKVLSEKKRRFSALTVWHFLPHFIRNAQKKRAAHGGAAAKYYIIDIYARARSFE